MCLAVTGIDRHFAEETIDTFTGTLQSSLLIHLKANCTVDY